eukprot:scaffold72590_cov68-Cyclotella_meneghiniana.AAC.1
MVEFTVESVSSTNLQTTSQMSIITEDEASFDFDDFEENRTNQSVNREREESVKERTKRFRPSACISAYTNSTINNKSFIADSKRSILNDDEELNNVRKAVANDVAYSINENMKTLGLLGALLSSWAVSIYAGEVPLDEMKACATVVLCLKLHTLCNGLALVSSSSA